jgi:hypothetical protein
MSFASRLSLILTYHFGLFWFSGLAGILAVSIGMYRSLSRADGGQATTEEPTAKPGALLLACFSAFVLLYLGFMFWNEDFAYQDGHAFTDFSAVGITRPPSVWVNVGRFWPLGYQEYNLVAHLSKTAPAYLAYGAIQLVAGLWLLYQVMPSKSPALRLFTLAVLMLAPAFAADFAELTYADRNVVFAVCVLVFCVSRYDRRPALTWLIPAVLASYYALYCKEMTASLFGTFAGTRILLKAARNGWRNALRSPLEIGMVLGVACFAVQLAIVLIPTGRSRYIDEGFVGRFTAASRYLTADPLLAVFLIAFVIHVVQTLRRGGKFDPLWDALAAGGVLHFCAASVTGMEEDYLMGPTELVAALTLLRLLPAWWSERARLRPVLAGVVGALAAATMTFGSFRLVERKNIVGQTQRVADFLIDYYRTPGQEKSRLYLGSNIGLVMNFVSYLSYRGLPFHRVGEKPGVTAIDVAGLEPFPDDQCVSFVDFVCHHDVMRPGDLVVHLAEEPWKQAAPANGTSLFQVSPTAFFPSLRPFLAALYRLSPNLNGVFGNEPLPDDWLRVSVTKVAASPSGQ